MSRRDAAPAGCAFLGLLLVIGVNVAWMGFLVWAVYTLVNWLITK